MRAFLTANAQLFFDVCTMKPPSCGRNLRAFALRALYLTLLPLRDGHDQFEWLVAVLAHELVTRHGTFPRSFLVLTPETWRPSGEVGRRPRRRGLGREPGSPPPSPARPAPSIHALPLSSLARPTGRVVGFLTVSRNEVSRTRASVRAPGTSMRAATGTSPSRRDRCP